MTTKPTPVPDVSDDPHAAVEAVANDPGERHKSFVDELVTRLPDDFRPTSFRARPTPFLFCWSDPDDRNEPDAPTVPLGRVVLLTGQGGAGKSHLVLTLAVTLASGLPIGSIFVPPSTRKLFPRARVLVVFGEETPSEIVARLDAVCRTVRYRTPSSGNEWVVGLNDEQRGLVVDRVEFVAGSGQDLRLTGPDGDETPRVADFVQRVRQAEADGDPYALVVLDPMTRFNGADENDNAAAARLVTVLERMTNGTRTTVVAVHHSGKGEGTATNARGASALVDNARCHLALARLPDGTAELTVEKSNYGPLSRRPGNGATPPRPGCARLWFDFVRSDGAVVSTLRECDKDAREVRRATIVAAREKAVADAAIAKHLDKAAGIRAVDAHVEANPGVPSRSQVRNGTARRRDDAGVQSETDDDGVDAFDDPGDLP